MAYLVEGLLFSFHLMGRDMIDTSLHTLLVYTCYACAVITLLELHFRNQVLASLGRGFCTLLQGTWFIQTAFILYSPFKSTPWNSEGNAHDMFNKSTPLDLEGHTHVILNKSTPLDLGSHTHVMVNESTQWDPENHTHVMLVACIFALHLAGVFVFTVISGAAISWCMRRKGKTNMADKELAAKLLE